MQMIIIGGGASGLMAAVTAAEQNEKGYEIVLLDGNLKAGKKIYATGNGKCNFFNENTVADSFFSSLTSFPETVYYSFDWSRTKAFFRDLGIPSRIDSAGRGYPYSEQASVIAHGLTELAKRRNVKVLLGDKVTRIGKQEDGIFFAETEAGETYTANALILATGGKAGPQFGSDGDGYGFARAMGHTLIPPRPALAPILCDPEKSPMDFSRLKGVRAKGTAALVIDGVEVDREEGEIQFTEKGLSGICIFNLSRHVDKRLANVRKKEKNKANRTNFETEENKRYEISLDLVPDFGENELMDYLYQLDNSLSIDQSFDCDENTRSFLGGIVPEKLSACILDIIRPLSKQERIKKTVELLKKLTFPVIGTMGWDAAQTTWGGVNCREIDPVTLESKIVPGLYFAGELLDVDGKCGGYNLQWAWSSGYVAGRSAGHKINLLNKGER